MARRWTIDLGGHICIKNRAVVHCIAYQDWLSSSSIGGSGSSLMYRKTSNASMPPEQVGLYIEAKGVRRRDKMTPNSTRHGRGKGTWTNEEITLD